MAYKTPGVFIKEISTFPPSVAQVETAIPAFIGHTEKAKRSAASPTDDILRIPWKINSMLEYEAFFGGPPIQTNIIVDIDQNGTPVKARLAQANGDPAFPSNYRMHNALELYFANGGGPCYILSVGTYADPIEKSRLDSLGYLTDPADPTTLVAGGLTIIKKIDEVTLLLFPDIQALNGATYYGLYDEAMAQCNELKDRFTLIDVKEDDSDIQNPVIVLPATPASHMRDTIGIDNLRYGAAYHPWLNTTLEYVYDDTGSTSITFLQPDGGDGNPGPFDNANPSSTVPEDPADPASPQVPIMSNQFEAQMKAVIEKCLDVLMPPSSAVAGVYAAIDSTRGVWKAPANVSLNMVKAPTIKISHEDQEDLNVHPTGKSINAIRTFTGKGVLIWGARTLAGNDNEWRYVSVRRFFNMVEESVKKASEQFVFEPNDRNTWSKVRSMIENFLILQWRAGALAGASPEEAFFVKVGLPETMTSLDILEGRMNVEIGMAVVRPAEFIILKFSHKMQEA